MERVIYSFIGFLLISFQLSQAQEVVGIPVTVSNIRVALDGQRLKVTYDINGISEKDSVYLQAESRVRGYLLVRSVSGAVGRGVSSGADKVAYWDFTRDQQAVDDEIRIAVIVKPYIDSPSKPHSKNLGGGPANAVISALLPGVGNILVQPNHKVGIRPLITVAYGGLLIYGFLQKGQSNEQYQLYQNQLNEREAQPFYDKANQYHQNYFIATRVAAAIWATDVVYTLLKGVKNDKVRQLPRRVAFNMVGQTPTVGLNWSF